MTSLSDTIIGLEINSRPSVARPVCCFSKDQNRESLLFDFSLSKRGLVLGAKYLLNIIPNALKELDSGVASSATSISLGKLRRDLTKRSTQSH